MSQCSEGHLHAVALWELKNWDAANNVLCRDIVPMGGTAGPLGQNRDCPAEIGAVDMSVYGGSHIKANPLLRMRTADLKAHFPMIQPMCGV